MKDFLFIFQNKAQAKCIAEKFGCGLHSGELSYTERREILRSFKEGTIKVLSTTEVLTLGVHGKDVRVVCNMELPTIIGDNGQLQIVSSKYLNRTGRCGPFGKSSIAVSFSTAETSFDTQRIEQHHGLCVNFIN